MAIIRLCNTPSVPQIRFENCPTPPEAIPCPDCGHLPAAMTSTDRRETTRFSLYCPNEECRPPRCVWADTPDEATRRWNAGERDTSAMLPDPDHAPQKGGRA